MIEDAPHETHVLHPNGRPLCAASPIPWNSSTGAPDRNLPGLDLHELRGSRKGARAVTLSGDWRVTFTCIGKDADRLHCQDSH
jgi:hypothetical protein